jgi:predicted nucleic acid-binding protein
MSRELAVATRDRLLAALIRRRTSDLLHIEAWHVAEELGWAKTYDAEYVALARLLDCRLLTVDDRLRRGAGRLVHIVGPTELWP